MDPSLEPDPQTLQDYQPRKLHIQVPGKVTNFLKLESEMTEYFQLFGLIEDLKVLRNSGLTRRVPSLCFRVLSRGIRPPRGAVSSAHN